MDKTPGRAILLRQLVLGGIGGFFLIVTLGFAYGHAPWWIWTPLLFSAGCLTVHLCIVYRAWRALRKG